jgi:hypothetical protein
MSEQFMGAWRVTEYVYSPVGVLLGTIQQRRTLRALSSGALEVHQHCVPDAALAGHAMADFAGDWVFTLTREGRMRRYEGPDVVGFATEWQPGMLTGRGLWPRFGCNFTSFSAVLSEQRQLTGGIFSRAQEVIAVIVGVGQLAGRDDADAGYPTLSGADAAPTLHALSNGEDQAQVRRYGVRTDTVGVRGIIPYEVMTLNDVQSGSRLTVTRTFAVEGEQVEFSLVSLPELASGEHDVNLHSEFLHNHVNEESS